MMDGSDDSYLDALVAAREVEDCGSACFVKVPGWSLLNDLQKKRVLAKVKIKHFETPLDIGALDHALQSALLKYSRESNTPPDDGAEEDFITPPPSDNEDRTADDEAREKLEHEGCPPCYPPNFKFPLRNVPEEYRGIISYWDAPIGTQGYVLCAQFNDWEKFRRYQAIRRRYSQRRPFSDFKDDIRRRRLEYGVQGDVHLQPDPKQQNRLQNWIEFQDYHFRKHEKFNREIADLQKELEEEPHDASIIRGRIASIERLRKMHDILLQWNEQQRRAMDAQQLPLIGKDDDGDSLKTGQRPSDVGRRKRQPEAHSVLGKARVSKAKHQRRGRRSQHEVQGPAPAVEHAKHPQTEVSLSQGRKTKPRGTKDAALRQIRPQKVSKARVAAKRSSTKQPCDADQQQATSRVKSRCRRLSQPSQLTPELKIRKSGRVTRKPTRWVPDAR